MGPNDINHLFHPLPSIIIVLGIIIGCWYYYSISARDEASTQSQGISTEPIQDEVIVSKLADTGGLITCRPTSEDHDTTIVASDVTKYYIFLDIDGTVTKLAGEHPDGLYSLYFNFGSEWCKMCKSLTHKLFGDHVSIADPTTNTNLELISKTLQTLCQLPSDRFHIFIATNNFREAVYDLWTKVLGCPWERVHPRSAFRGATINKLNLIRQINKEINQEDKTPKDKVKILYFDDDHINFYGQTLDDNVTVIDCSEKWLAEQLKDAGITYESLTEETLIEALEYFSK